MTIASNPAMERDQNFERLLRLAKQGDGEALEAVCRASYPRVSELVHKRLAQDLRQGRPWLLARFSTGDVVQDVFYQLTRDLGGFDGETRDELIAYLASSVKNRLIDAIRFHEADRRDGRRTIGPEEQRFIGEPGIGPQSDAMIKEETDRLMAVLDSFPPREAQLLKDRLFDEVSFKDLADRHGYSSLFVARRVFYAAEARLILALEGEDNA